MLAKMLIKLLVLLTCTWVRVCWHKVYIPYAMELSLVTIVQVCFMCTSVFIGGDPGITMSRKPGFV